MTNSKISNQHRGSALSLCVKTTATSSHPLRRKEVSLEKTSLTQVQHPSFLRPLSLLSLSKLQANIVKAVYKAVQLSRH